MLQRARERVPIRRVLCDREFDSKVVFQTLSTLDVNYLIPKRVYSFEHQMLLVNWTVFLPQIDSPLKFSNFWNC